MFDADSVGIGLIALKTWGLDLMRLNRKRATMMLCSVTLAALSGAALAEPSHQRHSRPSLADARAQAQSHSNSAFGGFTDDALVSEARKYIGTNPTGRGSLWCGAFMDMVLKRTGHAGGGNLASGYAHYGTRVSGPEVGAIAVMRGHVGVVSGIDPN